jgi:pimeloyl-ACP methyl ester carboxylesterase/membrane protein DedA with SNARE-associated domain
MTPTGPVPGRTTRLAYYEWTPSADDGRPPVLLLHGSPGQGADFARVGVLLSEAGYRVIAPDLPGFGASNGSVPSMAMAAHARSMIALLDALRIERVHVVGWSNGGGVALHVCDLDRSRVASLTLMSSIGLQQYEGSGSYAFEHAKYALGFVVLGAGPEVLPHFGLLGSYATRTAWLRNFWDSDQRPLEAMLHRLGSGPDPMPTLIIHGRYDVLVPWRAAEAHHRILYASSLVYLPANHFLPFTHARVTASHLAHFFERHNTPGVVEEPREFDLAPLRPRTSVLRLLRPVEEAVRAVPWWGQTSLLGKFVLVWPTGAIVGIALLVSATDLDPFVAFVAIVLGLMGQTFALTVLGRLLKMRVYRLPWLGERLPRVSQDDWSRRMARRPGTEGWLSALIPSRRVASLVGAATSGCSWPRYLRFALARFAGAMVWSLLVYMISLLGMALAVRPLDARLGLLGAVIALGVLSLVIAWVPMTIVRAGRQTVAASAGRLLRYEYWPAWVLYLPLLPYALHLGRKHGGLTVFTCCNPGIENAGGFVGESKHAIMEGLGGSPVVLRTARIPPGPTHDRVRALREAMRSHGALERFPLILKPDAGQRGHAVRLVHSHDDALAYFQEMAAPAIAQAYHPGPRECGIVWVRHVPPGGEGTGFIYSITRKEFPVVIGDGRSTLEELILAHPRHRRQAGVFLTRFRDRASGIPAAGEPVRLAEAGNHCQGTLFRDGSDLHTPALAAAVDALAAGFRGGLDVGRFDIRYESDEALRRGEGFAVVELNGVMGESTNLYDPSGSLRWAYRVLFGQWRHLYELGAWRRDAGARPVPPGELWRMVRSHAKGRRGRAVSD